MNEAVRRALLSLEGLSVGDAFGQRFFSAPATWLRRRQLPSPPWRWTDDTHMAISIVEVLVEHGWVEQDALAQAFARRFRQQLHRGYGRGAMELLTRISQGADWREVAPTLFDGGSYGNGAAMRAAPIGGFFSAHPERAAGQAQLAAEITHAHPEGQAGAMAVAAAAAIAANPAAPGGNDFLNQVLPHVPDSQTREGIERARDLPPGDLPAAARELGTGDNISAQDTVPFCLWAAAHRLGDFEEALWWTVSGLGDRDTTCAIVGGIVALSVGKVPPEWAQRREPLPQDFSPSLPGDEK